MDPFEQALRAALRPVESAPSLWRLNGCGTTMLGRYYDPHIAPMYYSILFVTFLMIPVLPLGIYLVSPNAGTFFRATISRRDFNALYKHGYAKLLLNGIAETVFVLVTALLVTAAIIGLIMFARH